jgi:hypothetical protein
LARAAVAIDRDEARALETDEDVGDVPEPSHFDPLGLDALRSRAALRIMAEADGEVLQRIAGIPFHRARAIEDREAAAAALIIALVGRDEARVVEPAHRIGFTGDVVELARRRDHGIALGVDAGEVHGAGREVRDHAALSEVHEGQVVVLLERHHRLRSRR